MMDCERFLDEYSDFLDDRLSRDERAEFQAHIDVCPACARYDRVFQSGTRMYRDLPELEVSEDFGARLQHRLYHVDEERMWAGRRASATAAVATFSLAGAMALAAWIPLLNRDGGDPLAVLPPVAAHPAALPAPTYVMDDDAAAGLTGLTARLAEVGVSAYPLPYREVVYHGGSFASPASFQGAALRAGLAE